MGFVVLISHDEFIKKYQNQFVEAGGSANAKNQCVDLVNQYIFEVFGEQKILWTDAINFPSKADPTIFEFIKNTPKGIPPKGAIIVWGKPFGKYRGSNGKYVYAGHIAIVDEADVNIFISFDQNYPTGRPSEKVTHNYSGVLGWLVHRKENQMPEEKILVSECQKRVTEKENQVREEIAVLTKKMSLTEERLNSEKKDHEKTIDELSDLREEMKTKDNQISGYKGQVTKKEAEIDALKKSLEEKSTEKPFLQGKRKMLVGVLTPVIAVVSQFLAKQFGLDLPPETILYLVLTGLAYIGVEGARDVVETVRSEPVNNG